jgi:putative NADPH-quinone reductase
MSKNILIVDGHPDANRDRYLHALADAYAAGAVESGNEVERIELATLSFPILHSRVDWTRGKIPSVIAEAQEAIHRADHLVILYPLWLGDMPALLKAFLEQVMRPGFALGEGQMPRPLLGGRSARLVVTMGMPAFFYRFYFGAHSVKSFERNILKLAGIKPVNASLIGNVDGDAAARRDWLDTLRALGVAGH